MGQETPLAELKGVGPALAGQLKLLGLSTVIDLVNYYPARYDDYSNLLEIAKLRPGQVSLKVRINQAKGRYVRGRLHITEAAASDPSGSVRLVWFNQPYRASSLKKESEYYLSGIYQMRRGRFSIVNPSLELVSDLPLQTARILAVYRLRGDLKSRQLRALIGQVKPMMEKISETLPAWLIKEQKLFSRAEALGQLHQPDSAAQLESARKRLGFEEVFRLSLASLLNKQSNQSQKALPVKFNEPLAKEFTASLEFKLTDDQRRSAYQIFQDMEKSIPMNRLVEGDVGSGKTAVAAMAAIMAIKAGWQVAFMAPTELLANQHGQTLFSLLEPLGHHKDLLLLTGSMTARQKKLAYRAIKSDQAKLIVGTQTLIQDKIGMKKLALVIIDEQHRFGVNQRRQLIAKAGHLPHLLSLSATPIPRSLALTLYGELDISVLRSQPPGRLPVKTGVVGQSGRVRLYEKMKVMLKEGRQMYVICPLINESDKTDLSVESVFREFSQKVFKEFRVGLLHGRLKLADKTTVMQQFIGKSLDILVSTTVIEVGVDIPNASIMLIFDPIRFGLAQLHQLRGRIGRGKVQGHCYLLLEDDQPVSPRLRALEAQNDGFKLAELDLEMRGPGAIYGTLQHGPLDLRIAQLTDSQLIATARACAANFIERDDLLEYKELAAAVKRLQAVTSLN